MTGGKVQVLGRDVAAEAYRIETDHGIALVPECLMEGVRPGERPTHQDAYEWIATHRRQLDRAVALLARGARPKRPYDLLVLAEGTAGKE